MNQETRNARAKRLTSMAQKFRKDAGETHIKFYIDMMTRTAIDLETLAATMKKEAVNRLVEPSRRA